MFKAEGPALLGILRAVGLRFRASGVRAQALGFSIQPKRLRSSNLQQV